MRLTTFPGRLLLLLAVLLLASTTAAAAGGGRAGGEQASANRLAQTAVAAAAPALPADPFGVYVHERDTLRGGAEMTEAGARWLSLFIVWSDIEAAKGTYDWTATDAMLGQAAALGYEVVATVVVNPPWAAPTNCGPVDDLPALAEFVRRAVARYSVAPYHIRHWSLYNEPDSFDRSTTAGGCWGLPYPRPTPSRAGYGGAAYANMLKVVYPALKQANPEAQMVLGALAYDYFPDVGGVFDPLFFDDLLRAGGHKHLDFLNFHYYGAFAGRWDDAFPGRYNDGVIGKAMWLRKEYADYTGEPPKPMMLTELGSPSDVTPRPPDDTQPYSEDRQADDVIKETTRSMAARLYPIIWFQATDPPGWQYKYGLIDETGRKKPGYSTYQVLAREMAGAVAPSPRVDFGASVEGYDFLVRGRRKTVLWQTQGNGGILALRTEVTGGALRITDRFGGASEIKDGSPQDSNPAPRYVNVPIDARPRIVEDLSMATHTPTVTPTPSHTPTATLTPTASRTPSPTATPTAGSSPTPTPSSTATPVQPHHPFHMPLVLRSRA